MAIRGFVLRRSGLTIFRRFFRFSGLSRFAPEFSLSAAVREAPITKDRSLCWRRPQSRRVGLFVRVFSIWLKVLPSGFLWRFVVFRCRVVDIQIVRPNPWPCGGLLRSTSLALLAGDIQFQDTFRSLDLCRPIRPNRSDRCTLGEKLQDPILPADARGYFLECAAPVASSAVGRKMWRRGHALINASRTTPEHSQPIKTFTASMPPRWCRVGPGRIPRARRPNVFRPSGFVGVHRIRPNNRRPWPGVVPIRYRTNNRPRLWVRVSLVGLGGPQFGLAGASCSFNLRLAFLVGRSVRVCQFGAQILHIFNVFGRLRDTKLRE